MNFNQSFEGKALVLDRSNIDTDQILPKQFMKKLGRTGFAKDLFFTWRFLADGSENPDFELNQKQNQGANILIAGENFGFGSSREHAVWALGDSGFNVVIAPGFAGIFLQNCVLNGVLPATIRKRDYSMLIEELRNSKGSKLRVDLENKLLTLENGTCFLFQIEAFHKKLLYQSGDHISWTLNYEKEIQAFETNQKKQCPWLWNN